MPSTEHFKMWFSDIFQLPYWTQMPALESSFPKVTRSLKTNRKRKTGSCGSSVGERDRIPSGGLGPRVNTALQT